MWRSTLSLTSERWHHKARRKAALGKGCPGPCHQVIAGQKPSGAAPFADVVCSFPLRGSSRPLLPSVLPSVMSLQSRPVRPSCRPELRATLRKPPDRDRVARSSVHKKEGPRGLLGTRSRRWRPQLPTISERVVVSGNSATEHRLASVASAREHTDPAGESPPGAATVLGTVACAGAAGASLRSAEAFNGLGDVGTCGKNVQESLRRPMVAEPQRGDREVDDRGGAAVRSPESGMDQFDVVDQALARADAPEAWVWDRGMAQTRRGGLKSMDITGSTSGHAPRFTVVHGHPAAGAGVRAWEQAGGVSATPGSKIAMAFVTSLGFHESGNNHACAAAQQLGLSGYAIGVFHTTERGAAVSHGVPLRKFCLSLENEGYVVEQHRVYAPDFGARVAQRRRVVFAVRKDLHGRIGSVKFGGERHQHGRVGGVLEPGIFRVGVRSREQQLTLLKRPRPGGAPGLMQIGFVGDGGMGRRVYDVNGLAPVQKASGKGPGWCTGLFLVDGKVSRLTVVEAARVQGIDEDLVETLPEAQARRLIAWSVPQELDRVTAQAVGHYLHAARMAPQGDSTREAPAELRDEPSHGVEWRREPREAHWARHVAHTVLWCALDATQAAAESAAMHAGSTTLAQLTASQRDLLQAAVQSLQWRFWLRKQETAARQAISLLREEGHDALADLATKSVRRIVRTERQRSRTGSGAVELLWWNWPRAEWTELIEGYRLPFVRPAPPADLDNYPTADHDKVVGMLKEMRAKGYVSGATPPEQCRVISPLAAVPKKNSDKVRVIIDMTASGVNEVLRPERFVLPTVSDIAAHAYAGCQFIVTDLEDGFYCGLVYDEDTYSLGVRHPRTGQIHRYLRLPMGLACSPHNFCRKVAIMAHKVMSESPEFRPVRIVTNDSDPHMPRVYGVDRRGVPVAGLDYFVDDGIITAPSLEAAQKAYDRLAWVLESLLGLRLQHRKRIGPAQAVPYCGLVLDSVGADVGGPCTRLCTARRKRCVELVGQFIRTHRGRRSVDRRELASLVGELMFAANAVPAGRTFCSRLYDCLHEKDAPRQGSAVDYDRRVPLTRAAWKDIWWWKECLDKSDCVVKWKTRTFALSRLWTDGSGTGYCDTMEVAGRDGLPAMRFGCGQWEPEQARFSSNWHELATIVMSVAERLEDLRGTVVHYATDNTTAVCAINTGSVDSPQLMTLVRELKLLQAVGDVEMEAFHLPGKWIIQQGTDGGSRQQLGLGQLGANPLPHDTFDPASWPQWRLNGQLRVLAERWRRAAGTMDMSEPSRWLGSNVAGRDSYWHLRPRHMADGLRMALDARLRDTTSSFTFVAPMVRMRSWAKYLKHFRRRGQFLVDVPGLGMVRHLVLRSEPYDARFQGELVDLAAPDPLPPAQH